MLVLRECRKKRISITLTVYYVCLKHGLARQIRTGGHDIYLIIFFLKYFAQYQRKYFDYNGFPFYEILNIR